jgi:hypothetical protein
VLVLVRFLSWSDVDPSERPFDPAVARTIAERHVLAAVGGDASRNAPIGTYKRDAVEAAIDRDLVSAYGPWAAGWNWAASEPGGGGPVRAWCCDRDSVFRKGDPNAQATIDRVIAAISDLRAFLEELAARFAELRVTTASLPVERGLEQAAATLLPIVVERTHEEDAWYATFASVLGWYAESIGADRDVHGVIAGIVKGRFDSWSAPSPDVAAATCAELGDAVGRVVTDDSVHDALRAWRLVRGRAFANPTPARERPRLLVDAHRRFIDEVDRARDPERASRLSAALDLCRASAARGESLTFARLAAWQAVVLGVERAPFRDGPAYARGGRVHYELGDRTRADFEAALAESDGPAANVAVRAARAYLDVCFFHPFADGNGRAARLALDHVLSRAGLGASAVAPLFVVARDAADANGAWCFAYVLELQLGTLA